MIIIHLNIRVRLYVQWMLRNTQLPCYVSVLNYASISSAGYTVKKSGETIEKGCSALPSLPEGLTIDLRGLGGHSGR